jgi:hypothetical protein
MFSIDFRTALFSDPRNARLDEKALLSLMDALIDVNLAWLSAHPDTPRLYESGVVYIPENEGEEVFADIPTVLSVGGGDCDDLVAWRVAELRFHAIDKRARVRLLAYPRECPRPDEPCTLYHVQVIRSGYLKSHAEDPSARLGMQTSHLT